jgi:predicted glycosyltransferase
LTPLADARWRLLLGPNLPADGRAALAPQPGVAIEPVRPDFRDLLARATLSVSQAGYNTVMDLLTCGTRSLFVPFSSHGQTEQALRAHRLAERGWATVAAEESLTPEGLARAIGRALDTPPPQGTGLDLGGAARSAAMLADMAGAPTREPAPDGHISL